MKDHAGNTDAAISAVATCPKASRCRLAARLAIVLPLGGMFILLVTWVVREPLLRGLAHAWIVDDEAGSADAVLVLCGGPNTRPFHAAGLYTNQVAPLVLVSTVKVNPAATLRVAEDENDINRAILSKLGVPDSAIVRVGKDLTSTWEEAEAVAVWVSTNQLRSVIIPTDWYHSRRVAWTFRKVLGNEVDVRIKALDPLDYPVDEWWLNENGLINFQNEVVKMFLYWMSKEKKQAN